VPRYWYGALDELLESVVVEDMVEVFEVELELPQADSVDITIIA
jgi:hypothetical protein